MAELIITPREHGYVRGKEVFEQILRAAFSVWVEYGSDALTLRRIAEECEMKAGNLRHYFASKEELIKALLEAITNTYELLIDEIRYDPSLGTQEQLAAFIRLALRDLTTKETTRLFPDLWAKANHDDFFNDRLNELYTRSRLFIESLVEQLNPELPHDEREAIAIFMQASVEGLTIFAGYEKPWSDRIEWLERVAEIGFVALARSARPGQISGRPSGTTTHAETGDAPTTERPRTNRRRTRKHIGPAPRRSPGSV